MKLSCRVEANDSVAHAEVVRELRAEQEILQAGSFHRAQDQGLGTEQFNRISGTMLSICGMTRIRSRFPQTRSTSSMRDMKN